MEPLETSAQIDDDPLKALADQFKAKAAQLGIHLMRIDSRDVEEPLNILYLRDGLLTVLDHAHALGVRLAYFSEEILDEDDCEEEEELRPHIGKCCMLFGGFPYSGIVHAWGDVALWMKDSDESGESLSDADSIEHPWARHLKEPERSRLVELAAQHPDLRGLPITSTDTMRRKIDEYIFDIAETAGIELKETAPTWVASLTARRITENQRAAMDAIDTELEAWAKRLGGEAGFNRPTAAERERFCHQQLAEHLGFAPTKTLSDRLRKLADSYRSRAQTPELFG